MNIYTLSMYISQHISTRYHIIKTIISSSCLFTFWTFICKRYSQAVDGDCFRGVTINISLQCN